MAVVYQFPTNHRILKQERDMERVRLIVDKIVALFVACAESVQNDLAADETDDEAVK